jgi:hypothetical protein
MTQDPIKLAKRGLEEMRDLYAYWEREFPAVLDRWEETQR